MNEASANEPERKERERENESALIFAQYI